MARKRSGSEALIDKRLREMFQALEARRAPDHLRSAADQLDGGEERAEPPGRVRRGH